LLDLLVFPLFVHFLLDILKLDQELLRRLTEGELPKIDVWLVVEKQIKLELDPSWLHASCSRSSVVAMAVVPPFPHRHAVVCRASVAPGSQRTHQSRNKPSQPEANH
jgi:hypothetical protein